MSEPTIAIVTVNYRTPVLSCDCIDSVAAERERLPNLRMVVVDNGSGDDSVSQLEQHIQAKGYDWVTLMPSTKNAGYAGGNNLAIRALLGEAAPPDYVWLLNPDTKLRPGAGVELLDYIRTHGVTIAGSRLEDLDGEPQVSNFNYPSAISELCGGARLGLLDRLCARYLVTRQVPDVPEKCDWLAGASVMFSRAVFEAIGLLDEDYFLYFEELDFCLAAQRAGHDCWYAPKSRVYHAVGASTGISDHRKRAPRRPQYWFDSRRRYFIKNHGALKIIACDMAFLLGYTSWLIRSTLFFQRERLAKEPPRFLRDFVANSFLVRGFGLS